MATCRLRVGSPLMRFVHRIGCGARKLGASSCKPREELREGFFTSVPRDRACRAVPRVAKR
jgi:hypothetical protein